MDALELYWYKKFIQLDGITSDEAELMAIMKAAIIRDQSIIKLIREGGLEGVKLWALANCPRLYGIIQSAWEWIKEIFNV